jgi:hypothetical protein
MTTEQLYGQISLFMPPEKFKRYLSVLEERMKDPDSADELMKCALNDRPRMNHFKDRLETYKDKLSANERQSGESFVKAYRAYAENKDKKDIKPEADMETERDDLREKYSLSDERKAEELKRDEILKTVLGDEYAGRYRAKNEGEKDRAEDYLTETREQPTSMLSGADMASVQVTASLFGNNQNITDMGLNSGDGQFQGVANASDEVKGIASNISFQAAVLSVRKSTGNNNIKPPRYNVEYGPGKLTMDKQLALVTLRDGKVVAYKAKDFLGKGFKEGETYDIEKIKLTTDNKIQLTLGQERGRGMDAELKKQVEAGRKREFENAREADRRVSRVLGDVARDAGRGMEM